MPTTPDEKRLETFIGEVASELDDMGYCPGDYEQFRKAVALSVRGAMKSLKGDPKAWLIRYSDALGPNCKVFLHNAVADYRDIDPGASVIELHQFPATTHAPVTSG